MFQQYWGSGAANCSKTELFERFTVQDFDLKFHENNLQNTPEKVLNFTEYIFSRWRLVNDVLT